MDDEHNTIWHAVAICGLPVFIVGMFLFAIWMNPIEPTPKHERKNDNDPIFIPDGSGGLKMIP